ncbi:MAG: magnesium transporter CorA family protein [Epsilonproteobacteria bacterium]|nr:magnesium transporter CorA family protein [Campylobacterota bacterium]
MYIFADRLYRKEEIQIDDENNKIIFTTTQNETILKWLVKNGFPETFIEDIQNEDQSVVYEENENTKLLILKYFIQEEESRLLYTDINIAIILIQNRLIFLCSYEKVVKEMVAKFFKRYKPKDRIEYSLYNILDILIDRTMAIVDYIDIELEAIEDNIFYKNFDEEDIQKDLYFARRSLNKIAKLSVQENDIINKLYNHLTTSIRKKLKYEFIDLKEHLNFLINESKTYLDRTGYLQNLIMGFISNRMNQAMQRLAAISLIFLPLTFIVGNYGMNFKYMPELDWKYGYEAVWILNVAIAYIIYRWLRKQKWI